MPTFFRYGLAALLITSATAAATAEEDIATFERNAMRGDYQAQRNVAYCLQSAQCAGVIAPNMIEACAWRIVIINSGARQVDSSDANNLGFVCKNLNETERELAALKAGVLFRGIYHRPLGSLRG